MRVVGEFVVSTYHFKNEKRERERDEIEFDTCQNQNYVCLTSNMRANLERFVVSFQRITSRIKRETRLSLTYEYYSKPNYVCLTSNSWYRFNVSFQERERERERDEIKFDICQERDEIKFARI